MERKVSYAMVGLFVIVLGSAWLMISLWLALGDFSTEYTRYRVYMNESVSGLYLDAPVKYRGVEIGKVKDIELNPRVPGQVQLLLEIKSSVPIKDDTIAVLTVQGLTGIAFVDLTGGSLESPPLTVTKGERYPVIRTGPSFFSRLDTSGTELVANVNTLAHDLADLMSGEGKQSLRDILSNIDRITAALASRTDQIEQSVENTTRLLGNAAAASEKLIPLISQADTTARAFEEMATQVTATSTEIDRYLENSSAGVQGFSQQTLPELGALISELRRLADILYGIGKRFEEDPRVLLYGRGIEVPGPGE